MLCTIVNDHHNTESMYLPRDVTQLSMPPRDAHRNLSISPTSVSIVLPQNSPQNPLMGFVNVLRWTAGSKPAVDLLEEALSPVERKLRDGVVCRRARVLAVQGLRKNGYDGGVPVETCSHEVEDQGARLVVWVHGCHL